MKKWMTNFNTVIKVTVGLVILIGGFLILKLVDKPHLVSYDGLSLYKKFFWMLIGVIYLYLLSTGWTLLLGEKIAEQGGCLIAAPTFLLIVLFVFIFDNWFQSLIGQVCFYALNTFLFYVTFGTEWP